MPFGNGAGLRISVDIADIPAQTKSHLIASLKAVFEDGRFVLRDDGPVEFETVLEFRFREVFDELVPPASGIRLFRGVCTVKVMWNDRYYAVKSIRSKVASGKDPDAVRAKLVSYLAEKAVEAAAAILEPLVE